MRTLLVVAALALATPAMPAHAACDQLGIGDQADGTPRADLNRQKNRTVKPTRVRRVTVATMLHYPKHADPAREKRGVTLVGVLLRATHEGPESPNCHSATRKDFHIWIGTAPQSARLPNRKGAVVVELTPNIQEQHPAWAVALRRLKNKPVCITGWLMYDWEHTEQVGKTRGTLWEVHPITGIAERQPNGTCRALPP